MVRAPASSANLGPGFDALGLALSLHDVAVVRVTGGGLDLEVSGEGSESAATGEAHLVVQAMRAAFDVLGGQPPGLGLRSLNAIPHGRGLGSSAPNCSPTASYWTLPPAWRGTRTTWPPACMAA